MNEKVALYCLCIAKTQIETAMSLLNCGMPLTKTEEAECMPIAMQKQLEGKISPEDQRELDSLLSELAENIMKG